MLEKLKDRLDILSTRQRGIHERHRTLRAAIEWSYGLLSSELQRFFASLSVFRGGWTIEAAEAVCKELDALDFLTRLRECSLVVTEEHVGETRFRMLETLREYAVTQLQDGERRELERRYFDCFLQMAEDCEPHLHRPPGLNALKPSRTIFAPSSHGRWTTIQPGRCVFQRRWLPSGKRVATTPKDATGSNTRWDKCRSCQSA
jgi:hypothetical protein